MESEGHNGVVLQTKVLTDSCKYTDNHVHRSVDEIQDIEVKQEYFTDADICEENYLFPKPMESKLIFL